MRSPSSSTLKAASQWCLGAAIRQMRGDPHDRDVFLPGTVSHACLEAATNIIDKPEAAMQQAYFQLITSGRVYKGTLEPPCRIDHAMEGLALARGWVARHEAPMGEAELGLAVDTDWKPAPYGDPHHYGQILDLVTLYEDELRSGQIAQIVSITDYKSAWGAGMNEVESLQMRGAMALVAAHSERWNAGAVEVQVGNLRKKRLYPKEPLRFELDGPGDEEMSLIRAEINLSLAALSASRDREPDEVAAVGAGCMTCPYRESCGLLAASGSIRALKSVDLAERYVALKATLDVVQEHLRTMVMDGSVELPGGDQLGFFGEESSRAVDQVAAILVDRLSLPLEMEGFLGELGLTAGNITRLVKSRRSNFQVDHGQLDRLLEECLELETEKRFGIQKKPAIVAEGVKPTLNLTGLVDEESEVVSW